MASTSLAPDTTTPHAGRLGYQPALDGVRAVAIVLVLLFHYPWGTPAFGANPVHGGFLGVDAFFVLSGFLITTLLLQEHAKSATVRLRNFYARRALRLLPALAVLLAIAVVLNLTLRAQDSNRPNTTGILGIVFYVANWVNIYRPKALGVTADTWSLAIEEQFYLLWPLLLLVMLRRRLRLPTIAALTALGVAASAGWRAWYWTHAIGHRSFVDFYFGATARPVTSTAGTATRQLDVWNRIYFGSDTRADALLAGCLTAVLCFWLLPRLGARARVRLAVASGVALLVSALIVSRAIVIISGWLPQWGFLVFAVSVGVFVAGLVAAPRGPLARLFSLPPLAWIGRRSYAIYLFHQLVFAYCQRSRIDLPPPVSLVFQFAVVLVAAELSYRLVEAPMLRRKRRFESETPAGGA